MPAYIDTGLNLVDVRDVAEGHLLACERGKAGERYILGCENMTLRKYSGRVGADQRAASPAIADSVRGGLCRRIDQHGVGERDGARAAGADRRGAHGAEENVRHVREGAAGDRIRSGPGG